ncbi:MAG TPA: acetyl-CoA carboxylase, carboxyltransferase subunit beta [Rectinemataceae bacterium]|nr:acetyl-CoA carboxylase, carboxyltransferase subunit beta [Rectinemataceae bacterium]
MTGLRIWKRRPAAAPEFNYGNPSTFKKRLDERSFVLKENHCPACKADARVDELEATLFVCPTCDHHFRLNAAERIRMLADKDSFEEIDADLTSLDPIGFPGYRDKLAEAHEKSRLNEAIVTGTCRIEGEGAVVGVMDFQFMGGSMGSVVGEKVARAAALAAVRKLPLIMFTASGGARMQESVLSLMQMAKTAIAAAQLGRKGILFIVVLTDPTTGGVDASFAMLGDVILAEPNALIGFAGARVIEGTLGQKLPEDFQKAEFQLKKGFVDAVVERKNLKRTLVFLLRTHRRRS